MSTIIDIPQLCLAEIATYLDGESLMNFLCSNTSISNCIESHKKHIQKCRVFETFTANPYKHCVFKKQVQSQLRQRPYIHAHNTLHEVRDLCNLSHGVFEETIDFPACPEPGCCYLLRIANGTDNQYITDILIKTESFGECDYFMFRYGKNALRLTIKSKLLKLLKCAKDGYYHLFDAFQLLVPKLQHGFEDAMDYGFMEIKSSYGGQLKIIRHNVYNEKAHEWISNYKDTFVTMPQVIYGNTVATSEQYSIDLMFTAGRCNAICLDIVDTRDNTAIKPEMVKGFRVTGISIRPMRQEESFYIEANKVHSSLVSKYQPKYVMSWSLTRHLQDCFIIPVKQIGNVMSERVFIQVYLTKPIETATNVFYIHDYEYIHFTQH